MKFSAMLVVVNEDFFCDGIFSFFVLIVMTLNLKVFCNYGNCSKILTTFSLSVLKEIVYACQNTGKTMIRLLRKMSDLGLCCLSKPFWQVTIQNFRTFTITVW